ncbi:hypothetical protein PFNF54_02423 [Plasmodium falciparum NF54]|uniref:Uncharacterized protein n=1 Tax=Plasmodium falciparum (isolate NF54) TaxID=5843 RepID=W7K5T8_PLAFO|nr:hypothetical protein PFNF54_02423 [Plasmodium falciparum NF54]
MSLYMCVCDHPNFGLHFRPKDVFTICTQNYLQHISTCHYKILVPDFVLQLITNMHA